MTIRDYEHNPEIPEKAWLSAAIPGDLDKLESFAVEIMVTVKRLNVACLLGSRDLRPGLLVMPGSTAEEIYDALLARHWGKPAPLDYNKLPRTHREAVIARQKMMAMIEQEAKTPGAPPRWGESYGYRERVVCHKYVGEMTEKGRVCRYCGILQ